MRRVMIHMPWNEGLMATGILVLWGISFVSNAQDDHTFLMETMMTEYQEHSEQEALPDEPGAEFDQVKTVNLNNASTEELQRIPVLTADQCNQLIAFIKTYGEIFSFQELIAIEGLDSLTINRLQRYATIGPPPDPLPLTFRNLVKRGNHELMIRYREVFPHQLGYTSADSMNQAKSNAYLGSPQGLAFRYRYGFSDKVVVGFTGEKDPGEELFGESQPAGMDFYSGFLSLRHLRWLEQLTIGTFRMAFGQGLTLGGQTFGSSVGFGSMMNYSDGFRPTQSACEYGYFRGLCTTIRVGRWMGSGFISYVKRDATVLSADTTEEDGLPRFSSFTGNGYHRTWAELKKKGVIGELVYGGSLRFLGGRFLIGISGYMGQWDGIPDSSGKVYQAFNLTTNRFGAIGINGRIRLWWLQLFGEYSMSRNGGQAWMAGLSGVPYQGISLLLICRDYHRDYQNPFSTALSQQSGNKNEQGIYLRILLELFPSVSVAWYGDLFRYPWVSYLVAGPQDGVETGLLATWSPSLYWSAGLRYSLKKRKYKDPVTEPAIPGCISGTIHDLQVRFQADPFPLFRLKCNFSYRLSDIDRSAAEPGYQLSAEGRFINRRGTISVGLKYILFDCPYYAARIYAWEPDILYGFSVPASYGRGSRVVLLIKKRIGRHLEFWVWSGIWKYDDRQLIGSGPEAIAGDVKAELKLQARISF